MTENDLDQVAALLQASTNLGQWSPLATVTNSTGTLEFTDSDAAKHLRRFYRTVLW